MQELIAAVRADLVRLADGEKAPAMQAYMKTTQPFYGVAADVRRRALKAALRRHPITSREAYAAVVFALWQGTHREEQYQALEVAEAVKPFRDLASWPIYAQLVHESTWWDTLDWIAAKLVSPLIVRHRQLEAELLRWSEAESLWVRRAALLAHLHHDAATNTDLLATLILRLCHEQEFFVRKAIGWVLRDYSYTNPEWVEGFVAAHADRLSGLSRREALKALARRRQAGDG